jgi:hypothetical protein
MKSIRLAFLTLLVLGPASMSSAQGLSGWQASVDALWATVYGNDDRIGDVVAGEGTGTTGSTNTLRTTPIAPELQRAPGFLVEARYRGGSWGFGGRGWRVSTDGDVADTVTTDTSAGVLHTSSVRLWGQTTTPFTNNQQPFNRSPLTYHAGNELEHVRVEGYAERLWLNGPTGTVSMRFGIGYARSEHRRHADLLNISRGAVSLDETLATTAENDFNLVGPLFAIAGDTPFKRLHVSWLVSPSALIGTAKSDATFEITDVTPLGGGSTTTTLSILWSDEPRVVVPALDLQLKAGFAITRRLEAGGAIFSSSLFAMPVAPSFDNHTGGWNRETRDMSILSYSVFVRVGL